MLAPGVQKYDTLCDTCTEINLLEGVAFYMASTRNGGFDFIVEQFHVTNVANDQLIIFKDGGICIFMMRSTCMASFICQIIQIKVKSRMANAERVFKFVLSFLNHIYIRGCVLWYSACDMIYVIYTIKLDNLKSVIYRQKGFI